MVNTFITSNNFKKCAKNLDNKRLGKQRVEAKQIIEILEHFDENGEFPKKGFSNHPILKMWKNYTNFLKYYCNCMIEEWIFRGYKNTMKIYEIPNEMKKPWWYSFKPLQYSHKASLIRKDEDYYDFFKNSFDHELYLKHGYLWIKSDEIIEHFDISLLSPIGTGAPANYHVKEEEVLKWLENIGINPKTGRSIKNGGPTYTLYLKAKKIYGL